MSDDCDAPGLDEECLTRKRDWIRDERNHDKWTSEASGNIARYRIIVWTASEEYSSIEADENLDDTPVLQ